MRLITVLILLGACPLLASAVVYDLTSQWSTTNNPNGTWSYDQGSTPLPLYVTNWNGCFTSAYNGWAPSANAGNCLPAVLQMQSDDPGGDFKTGDILVHSFDNANGGSNGEASILWTAPVDGEITFDGDIWYAHSSVQRSNDFSLSLGSDVLASGTIAYNSGFTRSSPDTFSSSGSLAVQAGDVLKLLIMRSPGQSFGSLDGVQLTITETSSVPEPGAAVLLLLGGGIALLRTRRDLAQRD